VPEALEMFFFGNTRLALQVWCTFLAEAFAISSPYTYSEFSGLEPSNTNGEGVNRDFAAGTPLAVSARYAIRFHMERHYSPELFTSGTIWQRGQNLEAGHSTDMAHFQNIDELIRSIAEDAKQAIKSWRNLRTTRLCYAMAQMERLAKRIVPEAVKQKDADKKVTMEERHQEKSMKGEIRFLEDLQRMERIQWFRRMQGIQCNYSPRPMYRVINFVWNFSALALYNLIHYNRFLRILATSLRDGFSVYDRSIANSTSLIGMLSISLWFFRREFLKCCAKQRNALQCGRSSTKDYCFRQISETFTTPNRIQHAMVVNQTVSTEATCSWLEDNFRPHGFTCGSFPEMSNYWQLLALALAIALAVLPCKIVLHLLFTIKNQSHASLMKRRRRPFLRKPYFVSLSKLFPDLRTARELRKVMFGQLMASAPPVSMKLEEARRRHSFVADTAEEIRVDSRP